MRNRRLSVMAVSRASRLSESTIRQLLMSKLSPTPRILRDIASVLQLDVDDLFVIAGLPPDCGPATQGPYRATLETGQLVAAASFLTASQVKQLVQSARVMRENSREDLEHEPSPVSVM